LLLNPTEAAKLIESATSRSCSRQNLERLANRGRLPKSTTKNERGVYRFREESLVAEYLANVDHCQVGSSQPHRARPEVPQSRPETSENLKIWPNDSEIPEYTISRARAEYEKANLLELERKKKEGELLLRSDVQKAWSDAINASKTKLLALPTMAKQRIPHLDLEEIEILTELVREALEGLADESDK
jgi:hypothetical protein